MLYCHLFTSQVLPNDQKNARKKYDIVLSYLATHCLIQAGDAFQYTSVLIVEQFNFQDKTGNTSV